MLAYICETKPYELLSDADLNRFVVNVSTIKPKVVSEHELDGDTFN